MEAEAQAIVPVTPASLHCLVTSPYDTVSQCSRFNQQHRSACCLRLGATAVVKVLTAVCCCVRFGSLSYRMLHVSVMLHCGREDACCLFAKTNLRMHVFRIFVCSYIA